MARDAELIRSRGEQKKPRCLAAQRFNQRILRADVFRGPAEMVGFVNNENVPAGRYGLLSPVLILYEQADAAQQKLIVEKGILAGISSFNGLASFLVEDVEPQIESAQQ